MYKLTYMKCVNGIGFYSGLNRKVFEVDLHDFYDKEIIVISGSNASGKTTFLSLVHPSVWPTNGRRKFIIKDKEGLLIREYTGTDGTVITTKCIYKPKKGGGHSASCYFEIEKPGTEPLELNPNGNVASYEELLYQYFGITKELLTYATYSTDVVNIVHMTDTERKNSVGVLVPNTKRIDFGFNIVNEKYKDLRNLVRNLSQRILAIRDEDSLAADLKRLTKEVGEYSEEREKRIRHVAKIEGRLKEITGGEDVDTIIEEYNQLVMADASRSKEINMLRAKILEQYHRMGITPNKEDSIVFQGIDQIPDRIMSYERKLISAEANLANRETHMSRLQEQLDATETELYELESAMYSIQIQDIDELQATKKKYLKELEQMQYTKHPERYADMTYNEIVSFSRIVAMLDTMIQAMYDDYGQQVSEYFSAENWDVYMQQMEHHADELLVKIQSTSTKKDQVYQRLIEKRQYMKFQQILDQRPKSCKIDTCPFIATALKWRGVTTEIQELAAQLEDLDLRLDTMEKEQKSVSATLAINGTAQQVISYIRSNWVLMQRYLDIKDEQDLYRAIANGTWGTLLDVMKLKKLAAILSEKNLANEIIHQRLPDIEHAIEMAQAYGSNLELLQNQAARKKDLKKLLRDQLQELTAFKGALEQQRKKYQRRLENWRTLQTNISRYRELVTAQIENHEEASKRESKINDINRLVQKGREEESNIQHLDKLIQERIPKREQIRLDLDALRRLKIEKEEVEKQFIVFEVIRMIMAPGKGIKKKLIGIYMYEIFQIANQLLLNTFDGKLYLKEFEITDTAFRIPYVYNGTEAEDICTASGAQQATIASAISLAILSKLVDKYGIYTPDEPDSPLNPKNRDRYISVILQQARYVGIAQTILITQDPNRYESQPSTGFLAFPGSDVDDTSVDVIWV